jgi:hypothetical protein
MKPRHNIYKQFILFNAAHIIIIIIPLISLQNVFRQSQDVDKCEPATSFIALSYCWCSQDWEVVTSVRDRSWKPQNYKSPISQKMLAAVNLMGKDDSEGFWIDQLCIDQTNSAEKQIAIA